MSDKATPAAIRSKNLALAQASPRCGARTRSGGKCMGMQMANGRCRMHGGASPGAPRGERHGMFKHGLKTNEAIARRRALRAEMRRIRSAIRELTEPSG
jgi:hypothetical protein